MRILQRRLLMAVTAFLTLGVGWAGAQQNRAIEILQRAQDLQAGTDQAVLETEGLAPGQESAEPGALGDSLGSIGSSAETPAELGREADDEGAVLNLFEDPEIRKLLGENPRFIYNASERPDPMIFPPVGRNVPCPCGSGKKYKRCHGK